MSRQMEDVHIDEQKTKDYNLGKETRTFLPKLVPLTFPIRFDHKKTWRPQTSIDVRRALPFSFSFFSFCFSFFISFIRFPIVSSTDSHSNLNLFNAVHMSLLPEDSSGTKPRIVKFVLFRNILPEANKLSNQGAPWPSWSPERGPAIKCCRDSLRRFTMSHQWHSCIHLLLPVTGSVCESNLRITVFGFGRRGWLCSINPSKLLGHLTFDKLQRGERYSHRR